ncbi:ABC transporter ATP-binding protein [Pontibacter sp. G13]|uniref:ABC transporter ATP-binding protein n=1 Tax=Pontibacter sp. G13 TaxID=3074898 RepID=UPI002889D9F0|nr:ABC transporter ATP-binding protein [Pontibacter sp. G13]WNJ17233.1 ABC transporter ATP-binding protein [Pontibacter sp. G13]
MKNDPVHLIEFDLHIHRKNPSGTLKLHLSDQLPAGSVTALMGSSGSGKTTLLKMLAGLLTPKSGKISVADQVWYDSSHRIALPPQDRSIGYVIQGPSLFPHMTVWDNLTFALPDGESEEEIIHWLQRVGMDSFRDRYPRQLSGGQQQRVALVRAWLRKPQLLLLDEPLTGQDADLKHQLQDDLGVLQELTKTTTLWVTHDRSEVLRTANRLVKLEAGKLVDCGDPKKWFQAPENRLMGEIVSMTADESHVWVRVGDQMLQIPKQPDWQVGDHIPLP